MSSLPQFTPISVRRIVWLTVVLTIVWGISVVVSLKIGSVSISNAEFFTLIQNRLGGRTGSSPTEVILFSVRFPRLLLGSVVGAALALAGAAFQSLLRNPLADPYVLGISAGASMGTILFSIFASASSTVAVLYMGRPTAAFIGALITVLGVYVIAGGIHARSGESPHRLLLAGIVLASFLSSINVFLLTSTDRANLRGIFYWLIGDLSRPIDRTFPAVTVIVLAGLAVLFLLSHSLNLISLGEEEAQILGVSIGHVKAAVFVVASLITGAVVSVSGPIAYVGLICPHLGRMMFGSDNRVLFPTVFVFGAIFTLIADTVARTVISPSELPVGVITALCGAPLFVYLLRRRSSGG